MPLEASQEPLDAFPEALRDTETYPWDLPKNAGERYRWLWGADYGKPLEDLDSRELLRKRAWLESQAGPGRCYAGLVMEIDKVLTERGGEI